jgi:PIN like domain
MAGRNNQKAEPKLPSSDDGENKPTPDVAQPNKAVSKSVKSDVDLFWLEKIFPKPEDVFAYRRPPISQIVAGCVFALDTNVLLAPYLIGKDSLKEITRIYIRLHRDNRLFTPAHAVREYGKNRARKVADVHTVIHQRVSNIPTITTLDTPMLEGIDEYETLKGIEEEIRKKSQEYAKSLKALKAKLTNWGWDDRVSDLYRQVFSITNIIHSDVPEDALRIDLTRRNTHKIPPGYKDQDKDDGGVGDLIIWNSLLRIARELKRDVAFVCNEEKSDWFVRSSNDTLMPRPELTHEFHEKTGQHLIIINWPSFLEVMQADPGTVEEAQKAQEESSVQVRPSLGRVFMHMESINRRISEFTERFRPSHDGTNPKIRPYIRNKDFGQHIRGAIRSARTIIHEHPTNGISHHLKQLVVLLNHISNLNSSIKDSCATGRQFSGTELKRLLNLCGQFETLRMRLMSYAMA